ncbi:MAG TPA: cytochrome P450 [Solirubrobacteraceae bacterium]|nr:cytochrome P450 [Solirubrobacteraceae bacterium]
MTDVALPPRFDALDPAVAENPYPRYAELRRAGALARGGPGTWLVTRHAEVAALLGDRRLGNELPPIYHRASLGDGPASSFFARILFYRDAPEHTRLRRLMAAGFTPRLVGRLRERIRERVDELLDAAAGSGAFDTIPGLADPLAFEVICLLLGIPAADRDEVRPRAADLAQGFTFGRTAQERAATDRATAWLRSYVGGLIEERRRTPGEDLLSRILGSGLTGGEAFAAEDIVDNCVFLFWAGYETVLSVIGTGISALLAFPGEFARLRAEPALIPTAIEEFLRYDAPIQGTARLVREPVTVEGRRIRPGRMLVLVLGSANHDERVFAAPERLDVARDPNPHLSFGGGPHRCLGNVLARIEAAVVFERLAARFPTLEPAGPQERRTTMTWMRFPTSVPVAA